MVKSERRNMDNLIKELENEDWGRKEDSAELLAELRDLKVVYPLIKALNDEDCHVREITALSLAMYEDPKSIDPLI